MPLQIRSYFDCVILLPDAPSIDPRVAFHTDLSVFSFGDTMVCSKHIYEFLFDKLSDIRLIKGDAPSSPYPHECRYNAALVGTKLFCRVKNTEPAIINEAVRRGIKLVDVPQGYAKCSVVPVTDNAVVTSDVSIKNAAEKEGLDVLYVTNKGVFLDGYPNGFIGGASVVLNETVVFTGDIYRNPDADKIIDFIEQHEKSTVFFPSLPLYDLGSPIAVDQSILLNQ